MQAAVPPSIPAQVALVPAKDTFKGAIARATGSFKKDHGAVLILVSVVNSSSGTRRLQLTVRGAACGTQTDCLRLNGTLAGTITAQPTVPDVGRRYKVVANGRLTPVGRVAATGLITTPGFIRQGREHLTLTLGTSRGQIQIDALSPPVAGQTSP
jgi:hypothetical protein